MRLKTDLYKDQQEETKNTLYTIFNIPAQTEFLACDIEADPDMLQSILDLIPNIRKYFTIGSIKAFTNTDMAKRPWFSVFKFLTKNDYDIIITDFYIPEKRLKTRKYKLILKTI